MLQTKRRWTDGDTYLSFGLLGLACGLAIAWHASDPGNWRNIQDTPTVAAATRATPDR